MKKHLQHEDSTLRFNWVLADDGGGTVIACWRDGDNRVTSRKLVVDDVEQLPESIADIIREDGRAVGEYPQA